MSSSTSILFKPDEYKNLQISPEDILKIMDKEEDPSEEKLKKPNSHNENLASFIHPSILDKIASDLIEGIESDIESRSEWENILKEAIDQLGISIEKTTWPFKNASGVYSSAMMQSLLLSVANICSEMLPPAGPVKVDVLGEPNEQVEDEQLRVEKFMNYYLTQIEEGFYDEMEQAFMWDGLYGAVFFKVYFDNVIGRPTIKYIPPQDFVVNYNASSLDSCTRMTQIIKMEKKDLIFNQLTGYYRDIRVDPINQMVDENSPIEDKINEKSGIANNSGKDSTQYLIYECHATLDLTEYEKGNNYVNNNEKRMPLPYIITIDKKNKTILRMVRNWNKDDPLCKRKKFFVKGSFWPGFGMYSYGIAHIAGGSNKAATSLQRLLIDGGILANFPGGIIDSGVRLEDNNIRMGPTEFARMDIGGRKIGDVIDYLPYKDPSPVLKELKDDLEQSVKNLVAATDFKSDTNPNVPATTTMLQMEKSAKLQNTVIQRLHRCMGEVYRLLYNLFGETLGEEAYPFKVAGSEHHIMRKDFNDSLHVIPVSDANVTSSVQRLVRDQAIIEYVEKFPDLHDQRAVLEHVYHDMKIPNTMIEKFLPKPEDDTPQPLDPIREIQYLKSGKPVKAYIFQNQDAYIQCYGVILNDPNTTPEVMSATKAIIADREGFKYLLEMEQTLGIQLPDNMEEMTPEQQNELAVRAAEATQTLIQKMQPQGEPPLTAEQVMLENVKVKAMGIEQKDKIDNRKLDLEEKKIDTQKEIAELKAKTESYKVNMTHLNKEDES